jgi:ubiquinone/menaquinone biosynthesis C-methylase UbiE
MSVSFIDEINAWEQNEALQTLRACGLSEGMNVLDFGCGMPRYTLPAEKIVGDNGIVYAVDKNQWILDHIKGRMDNEDVSNVMPIKSNEVKIQKFDNSVQFIMYYDMFHSIGRGMNGRLAENEKLFR